MDPHPCLRGPFNIGLYELVAGLFGQFHELLQFQINLVHLQLNLCTRDSGTRLINTKEFLEYKEPVG
jgi:hypothetical protein